MKNAATRYGASPDDWDYFAVLLGLANDLLPVVSNPAAEISPHSKMQDLGKTPSRYNGHRKVAGIPEWSKHTTSDADIARWSKEPDYGICLQCRQVRAIDVDVPDMGIAKRIADFIQYEYECNLPARVRGNSGKFLLAFRVAGDYSKRRFKVEGGVIEFLANGQQFIAVGTHPSGVRYEWDGGLPDDFPVLEWQQFEKLWSALLERFAIEEVKPQRDIGIPTSPPAAPTDLVTLKSALDAIPNSGDAELVYDEWLAVVMAMHYETGASDEGLELTRAWSARSSKHQDDELELEWGRIKGASHSGKVVTGRSILHMARERGWTEPVEQDFDVVAPEGAAGEKEAESRPWPTFTRKPKTGEILATMDNMVKAIERPDMVGMQIGHDGFRDEIMYSEDEGKNWHPFKDADYSRLRIALERRGFASPSKELTRDAVLLVAEQQRFDSAQLWLSRLEWDKTARVEQFLARYFGVPDSPYARAVSRYIWTGLAGRVMEPGCKADMAPVLIGKQGARKSSAVAAMVPSTDFFTEISFGEKDDDLSRKMRGRLIAELAELKGLHSKDAEAIKAWITKRYEDWTPKYREFNTKFPRRLLCIGTTNQDQFLSDGTGNRRYLPVLVGERIDVNGISADRLQLWAEARVMWEERAALLGRDNGVDYEDAEALAIGVHGDHMMTDVWQPFIERWINEPDMITEQTPASREFLQVHEVLEGALRLDAKNCKRIDEMRVGDALRALGYTRKRKRVEGGLVWAYFRQEKNVPTVPTSCLPEACEVRTA